MKVKIIDENNIIVFFNTDIIDNNLNNKDRLEEIIKDIIDKINKIYNLNIYGYYNVDIYHDKHYGLVIKFIKEIIDYVDYEKGEIDLRIKVHERTFLYKINNIFNLNIDSCIYKYKNNYYLKINNIEKTKLSLLLELSELIYDNTNIIINNANILQNKSYVI